ncbi:MAG: FtsX-like permease family protein, partial [Candidatus Thorarchaeota archaeon]
LDAWSSELSYEGEMQLETDGVLVSQDFLDYAYQVHAVNISIGSSIDIDVLRFGARGLTTPEQLGNMTIANLTVAGIYSPATTTTVLNTAFPSISRKNWDPMSLYNEPVLGLADSVMILENQLPPDFIEDITNRGPFRSSALLIPDKDALIAGGVTNIGINLINVKIQLEEEFDRVQVSGLREISKLEDYVDTYLQSQVLTLLAFPILIMSMMLTIFTSETSISRRKREISTLRSKGASFNQVFSTFIWESVFLSIIGLIAGLSIAFVTAPLIGATKGLFIFDAAIYVSYITHFSIPPLAIIIAAAIAMYLPASYILHVARRIDVSEVGQPTDEAAEEKTEESGIIRYALGLGIILVSLILMPTMFEPIGSAAVIQLLIATLMLFVASYLGSRAMRLAIAKFSSGTSFLLGEKSLYMSQSLRKRKGQFVPLMVILTLTLTTTTMMLIQSTSFETTLQNELNYALGADIRVECDPKTLGFTDTLLNYPGVYKATPVVETWAQVGTQRFFVEGIDAINYKDIGLFVPETFLNNNSESLLTTLNATSNGIIISEFYSSLWNKTVGDQVQLTVGTLTGSRPLVFEVLGMMNSAPGFGVASTFDILSSTFGSQFGFQVGQGGFALVNLDFLTNMTSIETASLFMAEATAGLDIDTLVSSLELERNLHVYTPTGFDISSDFQSIQLFLSGISGLTMVGFFMAAIMGLTAIALFLGSAVIEREPEYALFRALGASPRQVMSMVFSEFAGTVVAAIGISTILGLVFGYLMGILTFGISPFSPVIGEVLSIPIFMMIIILALESVVMLGACYFPARRASRSDPATVLRNL